MKVSTLLLPLLLIAGCQNETTSEAYVDPVSGEIENMVTTSLPGWDIHQFQSVPEAFISISQSGRPLVTSMSNERGRSVRVHGGESPDAVTVHSAGDGAIETIEFYTDGTLYVVQREGSSWVLTSHK